MIELVKIQNGEADSNSFTYDLYKSAECFQPFKCFTIHKSQGSEFEKVAIVLDNASFLLNNNLLYTALTRAKQEAVIFVVDVLYDDRQHLVDMLSKKQDNTDKYTLADNIDIDLYKLIEVTPCNEEIPEEFCEITKLSKNKEPLKVPE